MAIVLYACIASFVESLSKISSHDVTSYTTFSLAVLAVTIISKILLGRYFTKVEKNIGSSALVTSGNEKTEATLTFLTLVAAVISMHFHISLEGLLGAVLQS